MLLHRTMARMVGFAELVGAASVPLHGSFRTVRDGLTGSRADIVEQHRVKEAGQ